MAITSFPIGDPNGQIPNVCVRDVTNGTDLYLKNQDTAFEFPASVTKLMTLLLMYEYKSAVWTTESVTLDGTDVTQPMPGFTLDAAGFQSGDITTWEGLAYAILLPSSFEACQATARIIGDLIYANAGNTGNSGRTRFVERMNSRAAELGMTVAIYYDSFGGSKTDTTVRNVISARDLTTLCETVFKNTVLRPIAGTAVKSLAVTGSQPRTLTLTGYNRFINGPTLNQTGFKDTNVIGGKNGTWTISGNNYNLTQLWTSPNGTEVIFTTIGSGSLYALMLDHRGLMYSIIRDYPYLADGTNTGGDAAWDDVQVLIGGDGSIVDESSKAHTLTVTDVTVGNPVIDSGGGLVYGSTDSMVSIANDSGLQVVSGNMVAEMYYFGTGVTPAAEYVFMSKGKNADNTREWLVNEFNGFLQPFASSDGANWSNTTAVQFSSGERGTFFNGAPRHLALVKNGGSLWLYVNGEKCGNPVNVATLFSGNGPLVIGGASGFTVASLGEIDDFRYTVGTSRYTDDMVTLSAREFPRTLLPPSPPPPPPPPPPVSGNDYIPYIPKLWAGKGKKKLF